jgi:hypothetical protein
MWVRRWCSSILDADLAAVGGDQADDHVEAGGLAGAVGAEQADHLAASTSKETSVTTVRDLYFLRRLCADRVAAAGAAATSGCGALLS